MRTTSSLPACLVAALVGGCGAPSRVVGPVDTADAPDAAAPPDAAVSPDAAVPTVGPDRGFAAASPWVAFYGTAQEMGDLSRVASTFRVIDVDADPDAGNFTRDQILALKAGGKNRVISYFNLGSCEQFRSYWATVPPGFVSCSANTAAHRGAYNGFPDEVWMDVGNANFQELLVDYVAPRLVAQGVDGFFFDNLEIVEHGAANANGPCDASCAQGGLDLVGRLRKQYPDLLFVMQNATSVITRDGHTGGLAFPTLLDGIAHEQVYAPAVDLGAQAELMAWAALGLRPNGRPFWIATEDYVGGCSGVAAARTAYQSSLAHGFSPYATDDSGDQHVVCYWPF
jgi:cysteinyl-tRNA synthetase, unknown class